jgi:hypothetical protein
MGEGRAAIRRRTRANVDGQPAPGREMRHPGHVPQTDGLSMRRRDSWRTSRNEKHRNFQGVPLRMTRWGHFRGNHFVGLAWRPDHEPGTASGQRLALADLLVSGSSGVRG